jgi:hypothetical protein
MNRFTVPAKRAFNEDVSVVLIHTEKQRGKNLALKKTNGELLVESQLNLIRSIFGEGVDIVSVIGGDTKSIYEFIYRRVRVVENEKFEESDYGRSVLLGIRATTSQNIFIVDGSGSLDKKMFIPHAGSYVLIGDDGEAGAVVQDNLCIYFSYGVECKLGNVLYLCANDIKRYIQYYSETLIFHEILNLVVENGGAIAAIKI